MQPKIMTISGWVLTVVLVLLFSMSATMKVSNSPEMRKEVVEKFKYPEGVIFYIGVVEVACVLLFLIPQTAMLGCILLTGYLGGAVATHVRVEDPFLPAVIIGVLVWVALYLRDPRVRQLLPLRSLLPNAEISPPVAR